MTMKGFFKNPVNLKNLKISNVLNDPTVNLVLKEDIWLRGILILRSGKHLSETIIDKLVNFGINEVNVNIEKDNYIRDEYEAIEDLKKNFIESQNILIIDEDLKEIRSIARHLTDIGFQEDHIFGSTDARAIDNYIQDKVPDYLFINYDGETESYIRTMRQFLVDTHVFLTASLNKADINKLEDKSGILDSKFIAKPLIAGQIRNLISRCIDQDFSILLKNEGYQQDTYKYN